MPSITKPRLVNRIKVLVKRSQRFKRNSKIKPFNPMCKKLKTNNNLLAKALSAQKQENQLLFSQKVELASQLQSLRSACNKRDIALSNIHNSAKEMLSMLVTMTNHVTNTIMCCQEVAHRSDGSLQSSRELTTRKESIDRLSSKSPARGVVKPMVSGHTITKPTINLRRVNMQRINNLLDLSVIEEGSPNSVENSRINTSRICNTTYATTNRHRYDGERRRRLPERIPMEYVGIDDDESGIPSNRQETRLSRRLSRSPGKKNSENVPTNQVQNPSVALCDVSKLLQNSQSINIKMLQDSQGNNSFNGLSNSVSDALQSVDDVGIPHFSAASQISQNIDKTSSSLETFKKYSPEKSKRTENKTNSYFEVENPMEGPSWLLNEIEVNKDTENNKNRKIMHKKRAAKKIDSSESEVETEHNSDTEPTKIMRKKKPVKKINSSDSEVETEHNSDTEPTKIMPKKKSVKKINSSESEAEAENDSDTDSMEFTECINTHRRPIGILTSGFNSNRNNINPNVTNNVKSRLNENINSNTINSDDTSSESEDRCEQFTNFGINRSSEFVTERRGYFNQVRDDDDDDDDDDTIMLQFSKKKQALKFNINEFHLPVLNDSVVAPVELNDSGPEVTTTIQRIPQNYAPPNLHDDNDEDRISNFNTLQLPKISDAPKTIKSKCLSTTKSLLKKTKFNETDCSDSDYVQDTKKKRGKSGKSKNVKDPSTAKVVLQKLADTHVKIHSMTPDQSILDKISDFDATNQRTFEAGNSEQVTDSNSSTQSTSENQRPRRQKAPRNFKEPSLTKKLRRED